MSSSPVVWKTERHPKDCWDWITPEDVCRHALAAFVMASQAMKQPTGQRFVDNEGVPWAGRESFGDNLAQLFALRLKTEGYQLGVQQDWQVEAKQLQTWQQGTEHPKVSTKSQDFGGMGARPHGSEAETEPALSAINDRKANPEGLAVDAWHGARTRAVQPCAP